VRRHQIAHIGLDLLLGFRNTLESDAEVRIPALFLFVCALASPQSQPPSPAPSKSTQHDKSKAVRKEAIASNDQSSASSISAAIDKLAAEIASWKKQAEGTRKENNTSSDWWLKGSTVISAVATLLIAIIAAIQACVIHKQRIAMDQQATYMHAGLVETRRAADAATESAKVAKAALELSQRADISIEKIESSDRGFISTATTLTIFARNHGKTRGSDATADVFIGTKEKELRRVGQQISQTVIPPETTVHILVAQAVNWLDGEDFARISRGETHLVIRVEVTYVDAFKIRHHTKTTGDFLPQLGEHGGFISREIDSD
jgi:hypothetical protein